MSVLWDCKNMQCLFSSTSFKILIGLQANTVIWKCIYLHSRYMHYMHIHLVLQHNSPHTHTQRNYIYASFLKTKFIIWLTKKDDLYCRLSFIFMLAVFRWKVSISFKKHFPNDVLSDMLCFQLISRSCFLAITTNFMITYEENTYVPSFFISYLFRIYLE